MDKQTAFWFLITATGLLLLIVYALGTSLNQILRSEVFREKMKRYDAQQREKNGTKDALRVLPWLIAGLLLPAAASAAEAVQAAEPEPFITVTETMLWVLGTLDVLLVGVIIYLKNFIQRLLTIDAATVEVAEEVKETALEVIGRKLTDRVPMEAEDTILMDHEYDGIRELDNNLPPWWKYGFVASIGFAIIYLFHYHVLATGMLQHDAYEKDVAVAAEEVEAYLAAQAMNVDERTVVMLEGASDLAEGEAIFMQYCKTCHGAEGEGLVGPNMTDDYWLHGGSIKDIFSTIKYGAENGMKSWKDELNPVQMQQVSSFIKSLHGTTPANPKEPQGKLYQETEEVETPPADTDSTGVASTPEATVIAAN